MHLLRALLFLRLTTLRNILAVRLRRLKQPKYLFGAIAGAAYFWFFFFRHTTGSRGTSLAQGLAMAFGSGRAEYIVAAVLTLFVLLIWVLPGDHPGLAFTEAEVAFLFPAPLTRRQLIHYKLLDGLVMSLFGALFFTLMSGGARAGWGAAFRYLGAWWSLNANLSLQQTAAALTISRLSQLGLRTWLRRTLLLGGGAVVVAGLVFVAVQFGPDKIAFLLWPARLAVAPFLADGPGAYLLALVPAAGLVLVQYFWVHRLESPFEEASIARAQRTGEMIARARAGKGVRLGGGPAKARREPFPLARWLPAESALLWKNLMAAPPYLNRRVFLGAAVVFGGGAYWLRHQPQFGGGHSAMVVSVVALVFLGYALAFGPQVARNDLRGDLPNIDLLKAYPLPGWRVVLGGLLAPMVNLTAIAWLLLLVAAAGLTPPANAPWFTPGFRVAAGCAIAAVLPALCAIQLLVPNTATLVFPGWAQPTRHASGGGVDVLGQRLIFFAGQVLCLLFALLPAVLAGGLTIFLTQWLIGLPAAVLLAVVPVVGILGLELWLGVHWVGLRFEALDISAEMRP